MRPGDGPDFAAGPGTTPSGRLTLAIRFSRKAAGLPLHCPRRVGQYAANVATASVQRGIEEWLRNCDGWDTGLG